MVFLRQKVFLCVEKPHKVPGESARPVRERRPELVPKDGRWAGS